MTYGWLAVHEALLSFRFCQSVFFTLLLLQLRSTAETPSRQIERTPTNFHGAKQHTRQGNLFFGAEMENAGHAVFGIKR